MWFERESADLLSFEMVSKFLEHPVYMLRPVLLDRHGRY